MDEPLVHFARKMTGQLEKFLIACKGAGDVTMAVNLQKSSGVTVVLPEASSST